MKEYKSHFSVLLRECLDWLLEKNDQGNQVYCIADLTFGGGGHTFALANSAQNVQVISTDQDPDAYANGIERIKNENMAEKITLLKTNFVNFPSYFEADFRSIYPEGLQGMLIDLGVSSHHFDSGERGFSFNKEAPLDMRMAYDDNNIETAADIVNNYSEEDIANIIYEYGEERLSRRIAKNIVAERNKESIKTTKQLENIIFHSYPANQRHGRTHPATRTFQALRIKVNEELSVITDVLVPATECLAVGGRLAVISFHSLEDRIVKHQFKNLAKKDNNGKQKFKIHTKKPIIALEDELSLNPRSRSAKLRVIEKIN